MCYLVKIYDIIFLVIVMNEENLISYYNKFNEDKRLTRRHGIVEFNTAIHYILKYLKELSDPKVLDVGAGTGRYSGYLFSLGYSVTSVELVKHNLMMLRKNYPDIPSFLGNATNLSKFDDESFDAVLLFGPMYHLISDEEKIKALMEAKRVLRKNGYIFISYYMNDYAIFKHGFLDKNIIPSFENNLVDNSFRVISKQDDLYSFVRLEDIDHYKDVCDLKRVKIISQDGLTDYFRRDINSLSEEEFNLYLKYHLSVCERYEFLGTSSHVLDILKKGE